MMWSSSVSQSAAGNQAQMRAQNYLDRASESKRAQNSEEALALSDQVKVVSTNVENTPMAPTASLFANGASSLLQRAALPSMEQRQPGTLSTQEKSGLADYLFEMALSTLGSLDISNKPSLFLVYAHDNKAYGKAEASTSKYLIEKLSQIQVTLYSDQTPMGQPYSSFTQESGKGRTLEDILTSQLCLLPDQLRGDVKSVDQVVVCCSEVLGKYLKWPDYKEFYQTLCEAYLEDLETYRQDNAQSGTLVIRKVVKKFSQEPAYETGFHHVLTEIAFLQIREEERGDQHGIIPVVLTPKSYESCLAHFVPSTTVRMGDIPRFEAQAQAGREVSANQGRHIVLFKLLERVLADSNEASLFLNKFWQGYDKFILSLKNESSPLGPLEFAKHINDIFGSISLELHRKIASTAQQFCDPAWQQGFMQRLIEVMSQEEQKKALQTVSQPLARLGENIEQFKQAYEKSLEGTGERDVLSMYVPVQGVKKGPEGEETIDLEAELERFFASEATVFLLQGVAGTGKSTFNRYLALKKLEEYQYLSETQNDPPLVFFIELRSIKAPNERVIEQFLQSKGFALEQIEALRTHSHQRCIFIFDGYDEIKERNRNFYDLNELWRWERAKFVITSRPEYLDANYQTYFRPKGARDGLKEAWMAPFSVEQRSYYIQNYVKKTNSLWTVEQYEQALNQLSTLGKELERPIVLRMLLQILPELGEKDQVERGLTLGAIYEHYFQSWWGNWQTRLGSIQLTKEEKKANQELSECDGGFIQEGFTYIESCAVELTKVGLTSARDHPNFKKRNREVHEVFFMGGAKTRLLRFNAPFQMKQKQHYEFSHKSMQEYLVARAICAPDFEAIEPHPEDVLNQLSLIKEPVILDFLAESVKGQPQFKAYLHAWIKASKDLNSPVMVGASNAITVLVKAGVSFKGADLKRIRIPGADLSFGVFDSAQLQGSDLSGTNLRAIWLRQANLSGAQMSGIEFGELPYLQEESRVWSGEYSPDGKSYAAGLGSGEISVYMTSNWEKIYTLEGHSASVNSVVYSPSGAQLASGSSDHTIRVWDAASGTTMLTLEGHSASVNSVVYSPSGAQLASGSNDKTIRVWDAASGTTSLTLEGHSDSVWSVVYSPSGAQLASGSNDKTIRVWDAASGTTSLTLEGHSDSVWSVVYSPSGAQLASGGEDRTIRVWDAASGTTSLTLEGHNARVVSVVYSPSGAQLASGSNDKTIRVWDAASGTTMLTLEGHRDRVNSVVYSPSGAQLASGSNDKTIRVWDAASGTTSLTLEGHSDSVWSVVYSPSGAQLASGSNDKTIRVWDAASGTTSLTLEGHSANVVSVVYSPSGAQLASGSDDQTVRLWDVASGTTMLTLEGHSDRVMSVVYSPSGAQLASGSNDKTIRVWDAASGTTMLTLEGHSDRVMSVVYSPSGAQLASGSFDRTVRLWDVASGTTMLTLEGHSGHVMSVVYAPSGVQLASGSLDKTIRVWDAASGTTMLTLGDHKDGVASVVYSPSGAQIASGSFDSTVRLWDVQTGECRILIDDSGPVISLAWKESCGVEYLGIGSLDKSVRQWELKKEGEGYKAHLSWSTGQSFLTVRGALMEGMEGLSEMNQRLLKQRGARLLGS